MIKVGIIGCGFMGTMHANCYKNIEGAEIVALADIRKEKAEELKNGTNAVIYGDGIELIENADVDVIDICLPTYLHAKYALMAMDKVKYVFVEKPVALTVMEANALIEKSAKTGAQVQVGQVIRFWDEYVELKKIIASEKYGKVINANFRRLSPRPLWGYENWLLNSELSGGAGQDLHIHDVDYVLSVFGKPETFYSVKNAIGETNSYVATVLKYNDMAVSVEGTWDLPQSYPFTATFRVVFEKAVVENAGGKLMLYTDEGASQIVIEKQNVLGEGYKGGNVSDLGGYYNELCYFIDKATKGEPIEESTLPSATESLSFVINELNF